MALGAYDRQSPASGSKLPVPPMGAPPELLPEGVRNRSTAAALQLHQATPRGTNAKEPDQPPTKMLQDHHSCNSDDDQADEQGNRMERCSVCVRAMILSTRVAERGHSTQQAVRLVQVRGLRSGKASCFASMNDIIRLIEKPFLPRSCLGDCVIQNREAVRAVDEAVVRLCDFHIQPFLSPDSSQAMSMRTPLVSVSGMHALVRHRSLKAALSERVERYGQSFQDFLTVTVPNSMTVLNHGLQPECGGHKARERGSGAHGGSGTLTNGRTAEDHATSSDGDVECYPHCILAKRQKGGYEPEYRVVSTSAT